MLLTSVSVCVHQWGPLVSTSIYPLRAGLQNPHDPSQSHHLQSPHLHPLHEQQKSHFSDAADLYVPVFVIFGATVGAAVGAAVAAAGDGRLWFYVCFLP